MPASRSLFVVFFCAFVRALVPEPELRLWRRRRISGPINEADLPRKQMIPPPSDRGPIVLARRWQTMASCLRATVVNSPSSPFASPSAAGWGPPLPSAPPPPTHTTHCYAQDRSDTHWFFFLRGCYCAGQRRTRANIDDSGFHHSCVDSVVHQCRQLEPITARVKLPQQVAHFFCRAMWRQSHSNSHRAKI